MPARFSYQLYTSRNFGPLDRTLAMLAKHGFKEVEGFPGAYGDVKGSKRRSMPMVSSCLPAISASRCSRRSRRSSSPPPAPWA